MMRNSLILVLAFLMTYSFGFTQDNDSEMVHFEINVVYPGLSISQSQLIQAETISDLNRFYKSSWVREYKSVEITGYINGKMQMVRGNAHVLTQEQKELMIATDVGSEVNIEVKYIPENSLQSNDLKSLQFKFIVDPVKDASFASGEKELIKYLKESAISHISKDDFEEYELMAIYFTVNEKGQVVDARIFDSLYLTFRNEEVEQILLRSVCNMPQWKPAEYKDGTKAKQEFVLTVGSMQSCIVPLLNIRQDFSLIKD